MKNNENFAELIFECIDAISKKMNYSVKKKEFKFNEGVKNISLELLLYIESKLHKLNFHIMEDKLNTYSLYGKLDEFEKELEDKAFLRIHQSYLVKNLKRQIQVCQRKVCFLQRRNIAYVKLYTRYYACSIGNNML